MYYNTEVVLFCPMAGEGEEEVQVMDDDSRSGASASGSTTKKRKTQRTLTTMFGKKAKELKHLHPEDPKCLEDRIRAHEGRFV